MLRAVHVPRDEARRYLGYGSALPDAQTAALIDACAREMEACTCRYVQRRFALQAQGASIRLDGTAFSLQGEDVRRHLAGCTHGILLAVTLGIAVDRLIAAAQVTDMTRALLLDCCASAAVEEACDRIEEEIRQEEAAQGRFLTTRFSPGYGDFPLETQRELLTVLDAPRETGLCATRENILTPRKSVTAVMGVRSFSTAVCRDACARCTLRETCHFTKTGYKKSKPASKKKWREPKQGDQGSSVG